MHYNATVTVAGKLDTDDDIHDAMTVLEPMHGVMSFDATTTSIRITIPADSLLQATTTALATAALALHNAPPISVEAMTEAEFNAREGWAEVPELIAPTDAADLLGVSRQYVLQMIDEGKIRSAQRVGSRVTVLSRAEVEQIAALREANLGSIAHLGLAPADIARRPTTPSLP